MVRRVGVAGVSPTRDASRPRDPIAPKLLPWFERHRRPLPWRRDRDPYRIWISEVLLQQTQVEQARSYYERFLARFPSLDALARATEGDVLKVWEGAGYYARARNLVRCARKVRDRFGGCLPSTERELERLPGIGPYTAAAIASLGFGEPVLALESNGLRIAARVTRERGDLRKARIRTRLRRWLLYEMPVDRAAQFNEALMELGETICRPRAPRCKECPLAGRCRAYRELPDPSAIPRRRAVVRPHVVAALSVVERNGAWLVRRRPSEGLLGGLWEFPGGKVEKGESAHAAARRELREETGLNVRSLRFVGVVRHTYSHFSVELHVFHASVPLSTHGRALRGRWVTHRAFERLPKPKATQRVIALLLNERPKTPREASRD